MPPEGGAIAARRNPLETRQLAAQLQQERILGGDVGALGQAVDFLGQLGQHAFDLAGVAGDQRRELVQAACRDERLEPRDAIAEKARDRLAQRRAVLAADLAARAGKAQAARGVEIRLDQERRGGRRGGRGRVSENGLRGHRATPI